MSNFNQIAANDFKPDSPQNEITKSTKDPHGLGSNKMGKRNQHMIIHESQIRQQIILRKPTQENT